MTDVPDDVDASVPPLAWVPCDGGLGCSTLDIQWDAGIHPGTFFNGRVSRGPDGNARYLQFSRVLQDDTPDVQIYEYDVYDMSSAAPVAAWRAEFTEKWTWGECIAAPFVAPTGIMLRATDYRYDEPFSEWFGWGTPEQMMRAPQLVRFGGKEVVGMQSLGASDTTFAFDVMGASPYRVAMGSAMVVRGFAGVPLSLAFVEGNDAFFTSEYGNAGWAQIWRLDADGSTVLVRQRPNRHVTAPATDGTTLFWVEAYGPNPDLAQPMDAVEVWAAPYSADPTAINAAAHLLAAFPGSRVPAFPVAFHGTYLMSTVISKPLWRAVRADGTVSAFDSPDPGFWLQSGFYVDQTEMWTLGGQTNSYLDTAILRVTLPPFN